MTFSAIQRLTSERSCITIHTTSNNRQWIAIKDNSKLDWMDALTTNAHFCAHVRRLSPKATSQRKKRAPSPPMQLLHSRILTLVYVLVITAIRIQTQPAKSVNYTSIKIQSSGFLDLTKKRINIVLCDYAILLHKGIQVDGQFPLQIVHGSDTLSQYQ